MTIVLKYALAHQGASCLIGDQKMATRAVYTVQGGFPKDYLIQLL